MTARTRFYGATDAILKAADFVREPSRIVDH